MEMLVFNPYPAYIFVLKMASAYYVCCINLNALQNTFIMEANTMNSDQKEQSGFILFALKATKVHEQMREHLWCKMVNYNDHKSFS